MNHDELMVRLERERISYPDQLEAERYAPAPVERIPGLTPAYTPITEKQAARNRELLASWPEKAAEGQDDT